VTAVAARCPSDLALEGYLLRPERSALTPHLEDCPKCRARLARMRAEGEEFRQYVFPATVDAIQEAASPTWRARWLRLLRPAAAVASLAAAALLVVRVVPAPAPPPDYVGTKGGAEVHAGRAGLAVFVNGPEGARQVMDGGVLPAGGELRFSVKPDDAKCFLWMVSVDATGAISQLFPVKGAEPENIPAGPVPGGVVLDGKPGLERVFALCADDRDVKWDDVRRAAEPAARSPEALRTTKVLAKPLDAECQSSILLEKR